MLSRTNRLIRGIDYRAVVRTGRRRGSGTVVLHAAFDPAAQQLQIGFIITKAVGNAVTRNTIRRRLKAICAEKLAELPNGKLVIRALPSSATANFQQLRSDVHAGLERLTR